MTIYLTMLWWFLCVTILTYIYMKVRKHNRFWKDLKVPQLKCQPIIGNMAPFIFRQKSLPEMVQDIYNSCSGRYVGVYIFGQPMLFIKDLELVKKITIKDFDHFVDHRPFLPKGDDSIFSKNLFSLTGQRWKNMRSILSPAYTSTRMRAMFILINENAEQFTHYFTKIIEANATMTVEFKDAYKRFAVDVIASAAFGIKCDSLTDMDNEFYRMGNLATTINYKRMLKFFASMFFAPIIKIFKVNVVEDKFNHFFRNIVKETIETRERESIIRPDMIHLLMEARKGKLKHDFSKKDDVAGFATVEESNISEEVTLNKFNLSDDDLAGQVFIFFIAGLDTVSTVLGYTSYELALNMDIQKRLQNEIDAVKEQCNGKFTYEILTKMKYLDMVVSEVLRKWPPGVVMDRLCSKPYIIKAEKNDEVPVPLKKDQPIWIPTYAIHRDPQYYSNPETFDPERFNDENKANIKPFTYMPFGVGPRNCIASRFALMEIKILFVHVLSKFSFVIVEKSQIPLKLAKWYFNLQTQDGFSLGMKRRN